MAPRNPSRNPFAAPDHLSLADLIKRIEVDAAVAKTTRQNWCWALRTLARVARKDTAAVPAHPEFLRRMLEKCAPTAAGLTPQAWKNARSLANAALARAGITRIPGRYLAPLSEEWKALWTEVPAGTAMAHQLTRFARYCSANAVRPDEVDDETLTQFHNALVEESFMVADPWEVFRGAAKSWNNAAERIPGWPRTRVTVPTKVEIFVSPWDSFPVSLVAEIEAHLASLARIDFDGDRARPLRESTIKTRRQQLRWFLTALVKSGVPVAELTGLKSVLLPARVKQGLQYLLDRRGGETFPQLASFAQFLPALARRLGLDDEVQKVLERYRRKLRFEQNGMTDRHLPTLRRFDDPEAVEALVGLPDRLRREVERSGRRGFREALMLQTAIAVDLLLYTAARIHNLASIELDRHLLAVAGGRVHIRFPKKEVKNTQDLEFELPAETVELLELYQRDFRWLLLKHPGRFLFPGENPGQPKTDGALRDNIRDTVFEYTGLDMPPHRFRAAIGKIFLDRNPGQYEIVRILLGHKKVETTIAFYTGLEGASAARHVQKTFLQIRRAAKDNVDGR